MIDLADLATSVTAFAAGTNLTLVPAVPEHEYAPEVCLGPTTLDLPGFLNLAERLCGGVLYLRASPFDPSSDDDEPEDPLQHLARFRGRIGQISIAFAANGVIHFWEHATQWYLEWQELMDNRASSRSALGASESDERQLNDEKRTRLIGELADSLVTNSEFRAARPGAGRQRIGKFALPSEIEQWTGWEAIRLAGDRVDELVRARYADIAGQLDDLARALLVDVEFQKASSATAKKQVTEQFLIQHSDGLCPPSHVRDELYARTRRLTKDTKGSTGLF